MSSSIVELTIYKPEHLESMNKFSLPNEQIQFTALPTDILEVTEGQHRIVILSHGQPVGFFILHATDRVKEYTDNKHALLLTALSINHSEQGKGYAKMGMQRLKYFVNQTFPNYNEIVLAVNHKNLAAQKLYEKVGYIDTGRRKIGSIGEQYIYSYPI
ncbi:GNAT family N-acetyltransferase [Bacillus solimangrovi]|uniref:GNAT family N-acetyltransferase n=2 Tax=Bacillus solimangrovi TaxID=1305675 RepID=A0A1E5LK33_9BACI|nr:GNAT family N-acetyltransferase [Bacillus solimangrovi]